MIVQQHHDDVTFVAGDDWEITATLLDEAGDPLNLTDEDAVQLGWTLLGPDGAQVDDLVANAAIERLDPKTDGRVRISVDKALTATLKPGHYTDALRSWVGGAAAQMWRGMILVDANPFHAEGE